MSGAIIMVLIYGYDAKDNNDRFISIAREAADIATEVILPGAHLVTNFPLRTL